MAVGVNQAVLALGVLRVGFGERLVDELERDPPRSAMMVRGPKVVLAYDWVATAPTPASA